MFTFIVLINVAALACILQHQFTFVAFVVAVLVTLQTLPSSLPSQLKQMNFGYVLEIIIIFLIAGTSKTVAFVAIKTECISLAF